MNIDNAKSYATEENLTKGLTRVGLNDARYLTVCNRDGRFTAIFPMSWNEIGPVSIAGVGFMVVG